MAPSNWETGRIGKTYLLLEENGHPVLEIKWAAIKGRFSAPKHFKTLSAQSRRVKAPLEPGQLLPEWREALSRYQASGFVWSDADYKGRGALLFCPDCRCATLIQFFRAKPRKQTVTASRPGPSPDQATQILVGFRDHGPGAETVFRLFDIHARVPAHFTLISYRFEAGFFELVFTHGPATITYYRWGPASILLSRNDLSHFAFNKIPFFNRDQPCFYRYEPDLVEWESDLASTSWARKMIRHIKKPAHKRVRLWQVESKNRILGVQMQGPAGIEPHHIDRICKRYGCI